MALARPGRPGAVVMPSTAALAHHIRQVHPMSGPPAKSGQNPPTPNEGARMRKLVTGAGIVAVAVAATLASGTPASAADTPRNEGAACVQAGLGTLKSLGLLQAA